MLKALHVLKPGGHALVRALPRTSRWTATALKALDEAAGAQCVVVGPGRYANRRRRTDNQVYGLRWA
jgi:hypothetical protein